jgi:hypothetical protein
MAHEELDDMMLWNSAFGGGWRLAEYDKEDFFLIARPRA